MPARARGFRGLLPAAIAVAVAMSTLPAPPAGAAGVVVVRSSDLPMVEATVRAFRASYRGPASELTLSRTDPDASAREVERRGPEVVVAIGLPAARMIRARFPRTPMVYAMVPDPSRHDLVGGWITGVTADIPPSIELRALRTLIPGARRLGVLVGPGSESWVREADAAAARLGLGLEVAVVAELDQLAPRVRELVERADAIWMPADPAVATPESFRFVLEQSVARRRPLLVFSPGLVRAGALAAAAPDLQWVGDRAAEAVRRVQAGERPGDVPVTGVRRVRLFANLSAARAIGLELPESALRDVEVTR